MGLFCWQVVVDQVTVVVAVVVVGGGGGIGAIFV